MHLRNVLLAAAAFGILLFSCDSKEKPKSAATDTIIETASNSESEVPKRLAPPPGNPGPILIRMQSSFPTQIFAASATENTLALGIQSDARDISLCPETELPFCFIGNAVIAQRMNPNETKIVKLYESDTQSGNRIDDVAAASSNFVFALNEGHYIGDSPVSRLVIVDSSGTIKNTLTISAPDLHIVSTSLSTLEDGRVLVCKAVEPSQGRPGIICENLDTSTGKTTPVVTLQTEYPVRELDTAVSGETALIAWIENGHAHAAFSDHPNDILDLGLSTTLKPHIAAGLSDFAVAWQSDDAQTHIDRIPYSAAMNSLDRRSIILNGLDYRSIGGLTAISEGFLFSFRHQNTQQMAIVSVDFSSWHLLDNSNHWRILSDYGVLDIQEAHAGKIIWQTGESLVSIQ